MIDNPPNSTYDVFLSHAHVDSQLVLKLASELADKAHFNIWLDKWVLIPGEHWQQEMAKGLDEARTCVVCIGKQTPTGWFREEIERALNRQTKDRLFRVIPLILPGTDPALVDSFLELRTWVDFSAGLENEDSFHLLVSGIKGISPGRFPRETGDEGQLRVPSLVAQNSPVAPMRVELRSAPAMLSLDKINAMLVRLNLFDRRLNASAHGMRHDYRARVVGDDVVVEDGATGLMWQMGGSAETMRFDEAEAYAGELAKSQFAGFSDWRVPTLEEGMTLMSPKPIEDMHIDRIFRRGINFIWTSDQLSHEEAFVIYFFDGGLYAETKQFNAWVRIVRRMDD